MNKRFKEVLTASLNDEKKHLKWLEQVYSQARQDTADKIAELSSRKDLENLQTIVYQRRYQEAILNQIDNTLDRLHTQSFKGISDYMNQCYVNGYTGAMYDIAGQGIPIVKPIDEVNVLRAIQTDSKLSKGLYNRLGEDVNHLKLSIRAEVSRGIIEGSSWNDIATHIAKGMNSPFNKSKNIAMRIARTEGHRIQNEAQMDAITTAKEEGADVLKQWDATLDDRTRESHQMVDGEVREIDEEFSNGLMFPSDPSGDAEEVINCRCALSQRARWALDEDELETLKDRASYFGLDKSENFEDFKDKYLKLPDDADTLEIEPISGNDVDVPDTSNCHYLTSEEYNAEKKKCSKNVSKEDAIQIKNHKKADGSNGGYVATFNYSNINSNMRGDGFTLNNLDDDDRKTIETLRKAIESNELSDDYVFTRYVNADYLSSVFDITDKRGNRLGNTDLNIKWHGASDTIDSVVSKLNESAVGTVITEDAFLSASALKDKNVMKDKPVRLSISAVKGTHCYIPDNRKESEAIFADKSQMYISNVSRSIDNKVEIFVTLLKG